MLNFTTVRNTRFGVKALSHHFILSTCNISSSSETGLSIALGAGRMLHDFAGTNIENATKEGVLLTGNGNLSILNMTVKNSSRGVYLSSDYGSLSLTGCSIWNCSAAVDVYYRSTAKAGNISLENCHFINNTKGVILKTKNNNAENVIKLSNNYFFNNTDQTLQIIAPSYEYWYSNDRGLKREVDVGDNVFENSSDIMLRTYNLMNLSFHDNTVVGGNKKTESNICVLDVYVRGNKDLPHKQFDISTNVFERNTGPCVVSLDSYDYKYNGTVFYNQFLSNDVKDSVVKVNTRQFNLSENIFDNPYSPFDLYVTIEGNGTIPASNNWWGSADYASADHRIFDFREDISLMFVNITPILTDQTFDCSSVANCSGHGECVRPNGCRCYSGWAGSKCADYDCAGVSNCFGNGLCVGPNKCDCFDGWAGEQCIYATCFNVNNCSGHGFCIRPDVCICAEDFTGNDCGSCVAFHWGPDCQLCPACQNGVCDVNTGNPASILRKSTSGRHRPVSYPDGPMTARYRFT